MSWQRSGEDGSTAVDDDMACIVCQAWKESVGGDIGVVANGLRTRPRMDRVEEIATPFFGQV